MASIQYIWKVPVNTLYPNKDQCFIKEYIANSAIAPGELVGLVSGSDYLVEPTDLNAPTGVAIIGVAGDNISANEDDDVAFDDDYSAGDPVPVVLIGPVAVLTTTGAMTAGLRCGGTNTPGTVADNTTMAQIFGKNMSDDEAVTKSDGSAIFRGIVWVGAW
jgi:hypothetical protein